MKRVVRVVIAVVCMVALVVGYYNYLANKNAATSSEVDVEETEVQAILAKDFVNDYPATPRAVVKWYNRIITAYYAEEYTDDELDAMADQARLLLDDELLEYNTKSQYLEALKVDIEDYHNRERVIVSSDVSNSNEVNYKTVDGVDCAYVYAYYFIREGSSYTRTYEQYCLRKDSDGRWKILTWELADEDDVDGL